jgi:HD-GYP domain-containing protein (c-di-GMP phosphodiesterase class II)
MTLTPRWWTLWAAVLGAPMLLFAVLMAVPDWDKNVGSQQFHFYVVSITALAAAFACGLIVWLTQSLRETRLVFLGLAFLSIAAIFSVHGLGSGGIIHDHVHNALRVSSWLSVFSGGLLIALSAMRLSGDAEEWLKRNGSVLVGSIALLLGVYIGVSMFIADTWLDWVPIEDRALQLVATALTLSLLVFSAQRYLQAFLFTRLLSQWAMVGALVLLMEVQVSLTFGRYWQYSWWLYHGTYAVAFAVLFTGWFVEAKRAGSIRVIAEALSMRDAIGLLNRGHAQPIADLVDAIEWKDLYTLGHVRRVASYAVMMGKELGLSTLELRSLALGAQMHDVGKIGVPDRILLKPGPLTPEEFAEIKEHVGRGYDIAMKVDVLRPVTDAIRYHHERWDGTGYPERLAGEAIPLHARIVSVADAFDAMTSGRSYQPAVSKEAALEELRDKAGTQFDPRCVQAFATALGRLRDAEPATAGSPRLPAARAA